MKPDDHAPWKPAKYELPDATSIQALAKGEANPDQQMRVLKWIIESAAGTYEPSYRPGQEGDRDTSFAEGRRFVGLQIVKLLKLNTKVLTKKP